MRSFWKVETIKLSKQSQAGRGGMRTKTYPLISINCMSASGNGLRTNPHEAAAGEALGTVARGVLTERPARLADPMAGRSGLHQPCRL